MKNNQLLEIFLEHYWHKDTRDTEYKQRNVPYQVQVPTTVFELHNILKPKKTDDLSAIEYCELIKSAYVNETLEEMKLSHGQSTQGRTPQSFVYTDRLEPSVIITSEIDLAAFGRIWFTVSALEKERFDSLVNLTHAFMGKLNIPRAQ
ncbi:hypothetical protein J4219_05155 [Candidatus Woesearchaeota archaeon]|nr:hypothetical protein [Candidatus Woesearchaeota archaeon]